MDADVIIIGSGPAGVSAAWPLVEAGVRVLMLDAADEDAAFAGQQLSQDNARDWRREDGRLEMELGRRGAVAGSDRSPKFATPLSQATLAGFNEAAGLSASHYFAVGSLVAGGLSRIWGALATPYGAQDLQAWGAEQDAMAASYARVARRIGLSGPAALSPAVEALSRAQRDRGSARSGLYAVRRQQCRARPCERGARSLHRLRTMSVRLRPQQHLSQRPRIARATPPRPFHLSTGDPRPAARWRSGRSSCRCDRRGGHAPACARRQSYWRPVR